MKRKWQRDDAGMPRIPWHRWVDDPEVGREVYVVDENLFLSYRARGRRCGNPQAQREFEQLNALLGIDSAREETAVVRRGMRTVVLLGDHRRGLENKSEMGVALYVSLSKEKCPRSPDWGVED